MSAREMQYNSSSSTVSVGTNDPIAAGEIEEEMKSLQASITNLQEGVNALYKAMEPVLREIEGTARTSRTQAQRDSPLGQQLRTMRERVDAIEDVVADMLKRNAL